jgi:hypothetical protein
MLKLAALALYAGLSFQEPTTWSYGPTDLATKKVSLAVKADVVAEGEKIQALWDFHFRYRESAAEKPLSLSVTWDNISAAEQTMPDLGPYELTATPGHEIDCADGDDIRRMLIPFVLPTSAKLTVGTAFTAVMTGKGSTSKISWSLTPLSIEKVKDVETMKCKAEFKEAGDGTSGTGTYWIAKDGRLLKFSVDLKGWVVPPAGPGAVDAKVSGELK